MGAVGQELRVKGLVTTVNYRVAREHIISLIKPKVIGNVIYEKSRAIYSMVADSQAAMHPEWQVSSRATACLHEKRVCTLQQTPFLFEKWHDSYWTSTTKIKRLFRKASTVFLAS